MADKVTADQKRIEELKQQLGQQEKDNILLRSQLNAAEIASRHRDMEAAAYIPQPKDAPGEMAIVGSWGGLCPACSLEFNADARAKRINMGTYWVESRFVECPQCGFRIPFPGGGRLPKPP